MEVGGGGQGLQINNNLQMGGKQFSGGNDYMYDQNGNGGISSGMLGRRMESSLQVVMTMTRKVMWGGGAIQ